MLRAEGLGWLGAIAKLMALVKPWRGKLVMTFMFGVSRVAAFISVGLVSALAVAAVKNGDPVFTLIAALCVLAPAAGILHWLESWIAHDMAFRLLAEMRIDLFRKIDRLAPAYLVRRRTGDLVAMATEDVEMVEYFFAHTIAPAFVAVLVPSAAIAVLWAFHGGLALALAALPCRGCPLPLPVAAAHRPPGLARPRSPGRVERPHGGQRPGPDRGGRLSAGARAQGILPDADRKPPGGAPALLRGADPTDRPGRDHDHPGRIGGGPGRRLPGTGRRPGRELSAAS